MDYQHSPAGDDIDSGLLWDRDGHRENSGLDHSELNSNLARNYVHRYRQRGPRSRQNRDSLFPCSSRILPASNIPRLQAEAGWRKLQNIKSWCADSASNFQSVLTGIIHLTWPPLPERWSAILLCRVSRLSLLFGSSKIIFRFFSINFPWVSERTIKLNFMPGFRSEGEKDRNVFFSGQAQYVENNEANSQWPALLLKRFNSFMTRGQAW